MNKWTSLQGTNYRVDCERKSECLSNSFDQMKCTRYTVHGTVWKVRGTRYRVQGARCGVWGARYNVQGTGYVSCTLYIVPCTLYHVKGTEYWVKCEGKSESLSLFLPLIRWHITNPSDQMTKQQDKDSSPDLRLPDPYSGTDQQIYRWIDSSECQSICKSPEDQMNTDSQV